MTSRTMTLESTKNVKSKTTLGHPSQQAELVKAGVCFHEIFILSEADPQVRMLTRLSIFKLYVTQFPLIASNLRIDWHYGIFSAI